MSATDERLEWTQAEFIEEAKRRFGDDPLRWAFACPHCGDVATPQDFKDAGADPKPDRAGTHRKITGRPRRRANRRRRPVEGISWLRLPGPA
jgi:hypothetical protein